MTDTTVNEMVWSRKVSGQVSLVEDCLEPFICVKTVKVRSSQRELGGCVAMSIAKTKAVKRVNLE